MRFVIGLMIGLMLGASIGLLASPERSSGAVRLIREQIQRRGETDLDADDSSDE
jgi:gas vesicle protein